MPRCLRSRELKLARLEEENQRYCELKVSPNVIKNVNLLINSYFIAARGRGRGAGGGPGKKNL